MSVIYAVYAYVPGVNYGRPVPQFVSAYRDERGAWQKVREINRIGRAFYRPIHGEMEETEYNVAGGRMAELMMGRAHNWQ